MRAFTPLVFLCLPYMSLSEDVENGAKLRFYFGSVDNYKELLLNSATQIFSTSWYDSQKDTVIFAHGFTGYPDGPAVTSIIQAYLDQYRSNVALLNWQHLAAASQRNIPSSYIGWAAPNCRALGLQFASTLLDLQSSGLRVNTTHLVGHSLGAQLFGIAGNTLMAKGTQLPWITGLDPASIGFENKPPYNKLHAGSAAFVDIIHSDPSKYGYKKSMGTVDFWPNFRNVGPVVQPGCEGAPNNSMFTSGDLCNHNRSWQYLVDSIKYNNSIIGSYAKNFRTWKNYSKEERRAVTLPLGWLRTDVKPGDYYFITKDSSPFGLGEDGL